jgi:BMFP domain-containing protein YqiC
MVHHHHLCPAGAKSGNKVGADETGPASDNMHGRSSEASTLRDQAEAYRRWKDRPASKGRKGKAMKDQGGGRARLMDDLAGVAGGAFSVLTGIRAEVEAIAKAQAEAIIRRLDLVRREELDAAMDVARRAREQAEDLAARVAALEAGAFSSQVEPLGGSENATKHSKAFSSQVEPLGGSENATKHSKPAPKSGGKSSSGT